MKLGDKQRDTQIGRKVYIKEKQKIQQVPTQKSNREIGRQVYLKEKQKVLQVPTQKTNREIDRQVYASNFSKKSNRYLPGRQTERQVGRYMPQILAKSPIRTYLEDKQRDRQVGIKKNNTYLLPRQTTETQTYKDLNRLKAKKMNRYNANLLEKVTKFKEILKPSVSMLE